MSTVLRPVGDLPPQTYWIRRGLVVGLPLLLILIIAVSCSGGGKSPSANGHSPNPTVTHTAAAPQPCGTADVTLKLSTDHDNPSGNPTYAIGATPKFTGTFTNISRTACTLTFSASDEDWTVISGTTTIWTTKGCPRSTTAKTKTLQPGATKTRSITWEGREYSKCQPTSDLQPGQYVLRTDLDGHQPASGTVFQMTPATGG